MNLFALSHYKIIKMDADPEVDYSGAKHSDPGHWRISVWADTARRAHNYPCKPSVKVTYDKKFRCGGFHKKTTVEVTNEDTINAGKRLKDAGLNPVLLNFADDVWAGGAVESGSGAQEESLWRRTNLCETQEQDFYPLAARVPEGIYTPLATVFKDTEFADCVDLAEPWQASFVAVPGLRYPTVGPDMRLSAADVMILRRKIRLIFQIAHIYKHDSIVLGALGCGAWRNPPAHVAEIFDEEVENVQGLFKHITFACLHIESPEYVKHPSKYTNNYKIFKSIINETA